MVLREIKRIWAVADDNGMQLLREYLRVLKKSVGLN
jgi:hypothetical protein